MRKTSPNMRVHAKKLTYQLIGVCIVLLVVGPLLVRYHSYTVSQAKEKHKQEKAQRYLEAALAKIKCDPAAAGQDSAFIKQVKTNTSVFIPNKTTLQKLNHEELAFLYHRYIENLQYFCYKIARLGEIRDGGWDVCEESKFRPKQPCIIYSFGINNDFTFDDSAVDEYGCEVHSFDPSMGIKDFHRRELNYYYNLGIASNDTITDMSWEVRKFSTIKKKLGHQEKKISIVKIDIEMMEWEVLDDMAKSGDLDSVDNLMIEFHLDMNYPPAEADRDTYLRDLLVLKALYDQGFRIFWTHRNVAGSLIYKSKCKQILRVNCHEVSFIRIKKQ